MILLKLGGVKHLSRHRWEDALKYFDKIYCVCLFDEEVLGDTNQIEYIRMRKTFINWFIIKFTKRTRQYKWMSFLHVHFLKFMKIYNSDMLKKVQKVKYTHVLSSYSDYDRSDFLTLMVHEVVNKPIARAYKESRPGFNYYEYECFKICDKFILNTDENKNFFEAKYGDDIFGNKEVITGWDENAMASSIISNIVYRKKLSENDGKKHAVILAGRVFSAPEDKRSGSRLYYINLIKEFNKAGIVVHLHTPKILKDKNGINQYEKLQNQSDGMFILEDPLDFTNNCSLSCSVLSRYDFGVLHNFIETSTVSQFDKINIPHRFYEYTASHVLPICKKHDTVVLEEMFIKHKCGVLYDNLSELNNCNIKNYKFYNPTYDNYIKGAILKEGEKEL